MPTVDELTGMAQWLKENGYTTAYSGLMLAAYARRRYDRDPSSCTKWS